MKGIYLVIFTFFLSVTLTGQAVLIDSLQKELRAAKDDADRIQLCVEMGWQVRQLAPEFSYQLAMQAWKLAEGLEENKRKPFHLHLVGLGYYHAGRLDTAIIFFKQAEKQTLELKDREEAVRQLSLMGQASQEYGYYPLSLDHCELALSIAGELPDPELRAIVLEQTASVYGEIKDYPKELEYLRRALEYWEGKNAQKNLAVILHKIGQNLVEQESFEYALTYFFRSRQVHREVDPDLLLLSVQYQIGSCYQEMNEPDSAFLHFQYALKLARQHDIKPVQVHCLLRLGRAYRQEGRLTPALAGFEQGFALSDSIGMAEEKATAAEAISRIYKDLSKSLPALEYLELSKHIQDSLSVAEQKEARLRMEASHAYERELQEQAHEEEKARIRSTLQLRRQRSFQLFLAAGLLITFLLLLVIIRFYRIRQRANRKLEILHRETLEQKNLLEQQKARLEELDRMKSHFFTNISHEFRTPLTIIDGMVHQIKVAPSQWLDKGLRMIERNNGNLLRMVNQILDLRKLESGKMQLQLVQDDVIYYLRYLFETFHSLAESRGISMHLLCERKELRMDYDQDKMMQIVSNLLSNALKYTMENGDVYFIIAVEENAAPSGGSFPSGAQAWLILKVIDTGAGIPADELPNIFNRFYQVDDWPNRNKGKGTGIGLALTSELTRLMEGTIEVRSEVGKGTTFTVSLPVKRQAAEPLATSPLGISQSVVYTAQAPAALEVESFPQRPKNQLKLLIIEDNPDTVQYLVALLEKDYELEIAYDGQAGIDLAIEKIPDLIISDLSMPRRNGYEVCQTLRTDIRTSHIPIVLVTASAEDEARISGLEWGADAYLSKPFNRKELAVRLEKLHEVRMQLQARYSSLEPSSYKGNVTSRPSEREEAFLFKLREVVEARLDDENFGIAELCKAMAMSRSQLHLKIKALTNSSTSHYMRAIRLHKAKEILTTSDLSISQTAFEVGFKSPEYFTRLFTKEFGVPPSKISKH